MAELVPEPGFDMVEAAAIAGLDRTYLYQLAKERKLRTYVGLTGKRKVSRTELEIFVRNREEK